MGEYSIGLDIGGTNIRIGLQSTGGSIKCFEKIPRGQVLTGTHSTDALAEFISQYIERHRGGEKPFNIVLGFPATLDVQRRAIIQAPNIPGIDDDELYNQYQLYSLHGQSKDALAKTKLGAWEYDIIGSWYKCNMTDIMAGIGLKQLERYPKMLERRREIIAKYDNMCEQLGIFHLKHFGKDYMSSGHLYLIRIPGITVDQRQEIIEKMAELGVATNVHYKPLPMMSAYQSYGWNIGDFPNAYDYYHNLITLPLHTKLTNEDVDYVIDVFRYVVKDYFG